MNAPNGQAEFLADQTRRAFFGRAAGGFGALALGCLLREQGVARPARPHFAPRAKRVIHLFMNGGPSQVDTFDPKPSLDKYHGQRPPNANLWYSVCNPIYIHIRSLGCWV